MRAGVRPARCVSMPSWATLATVPTFGLSPAANMPMATSAPSDRMGSGFNSGGRWAWSTSSSLGEEGEQGQVVAEMTRDEEVPADMLPAGRSHAPDQLGIAEKVPDAEGRALDGLHGIARHAEDHLVGNSSRQAAHDGLAFPH